VVKVIWHKAHRCRTRLVQCYSAGDGNVSFHKGTVAPPGEYDWTCASFGPLQSTTETENGSVQPFLHSLRQKVPTIYNGHPCPPELPLPMGIWTSHVTHDAFRPCEPTTQMAPRSVQSSLHRWPRSVSILYNGLPVFPSKLPLPMLVSGPHVIHGSLGPGKSGKQMSTWSFQPFLQGSLVWQTDRPRYSVRCGVIMRNYVGYGKAIRSFHVSTNNFATIESLYVRLKHSIKYLV